MIMVYEDFTEFEEVDPDDELTVTSNKIAVSDQNYDMDSRVYKDYGKNHFDGDFTHKLEVTITDKGEEPMLGIWAVSTVATDWDGWIDTPTICLTFEVGGPPGNFILVLRNRAEEYEESVTLLLNTRYYITIERSGSEYTVTIRTGSHEGTVVDTLSLDFGVATAFQYLYAQFELG